MARASLRMLSPSRSVYEQIAPAQDFAIAGQGKQALPPRAGARQHLRVVVAKDGKVSALGPELHATIRCRPLAGQIAEGNDDVGGRDLDARQQIVQLVEASVDIADEDVTSGHDPAPGCDLVCSGRP